ncbi:MAG: hypothetical protein O3C57_06995, partial [Verrucomicrobia bacterium]|nr:hypothetical protein [Verrucomicrobiota bacterium]
MDKKVERSKMTQREVQGDLVLGEAQKPEQETLERAKQVRNSQMALAAEELERLRLLQVEIEQKHVELGEIGHKQDAYQRTKREVTQGLERALARLERHSAECAKSLDVIEETRKAFRVQLAAIQKLQESQWGSVDFEESLNRAFGVVD